jgi:hypothetical protein
VTAPYRKKQEKTLESLEQELQALVKRVQYLEKQHAKEKQVQTKRNQS